MIDMKKVKRWNAERASHPLALTKTIVPIRDTFKDGAPVAFLIEFYGMPSRQLQFIQAGPDPSYEDGINPHIGARPIREALKKRGFDTNRYQPFLFDGFEEEEWRHVK